ncbi:MAG: efflux transporter outer membrane subunit [Desulfobacteraceae bacterium]
MYKFIVTVLALMFLLGCAAGSKDSTLLPEMDLPAEYIIKSDKTSKIEKWWEDFNNSELNALVEKSLEKNYSLKAAFASLKKARAVAAMSSADLFPDLDIEAGTSRTNTHKDGHTDISESSSLGLAASYEIDLWGRIKSERDAALLTEKAVEKDLEAAAVTVSSQVVNAWKDIVFSRKRLKLLKALERANADQLEILRQRYASGMVNGSDVYDQKKNLLSVKADIKALSSQISVLQNKMACLTGESNPLPVLGENICRIALLPDAGIPTTLLKSRPDVNAARLRLMSAHENLGSARAALLPRFSISASLSTESDDFSVSFEDWMSNLAANLIAPVFQGGYLKNQVKKSEAEKEESLHNYASIVLTAVNEVRDALAREKFQKQRIDFVRKSLEAAKAALYHSEIEYINGSSDYVSYIERYNFMKNIEISLVNEMADLVSYRVALYRSIGNKWTKGFVERLGKADEQ